MLRSRSAATDGELDGEFRERRTLPERPRGQTELLRGERGQDLGVRRSIIKRPAPSRRDMSVSLLQRSLKPPPTCSGVTERKSVSNEVVCASLCVCECVSAYLLPPGPGVPLLLLQLLQAAAPGRLLRLPLQILL